MTKDIAIIGGSAAGFFTAYLLAHQGLHVRLYEAEEAIDPSPRTLIVTSHMANFTGSLCESAVVNEIHCFQLFVEGRSVTIPLRRPEMVIERSILIKELKAQAEASGAKVLTGRRFLSVAPNGRSLIFTVSANGYAEVVEESANVLVGADGALSKVAQSAGWPKQSTVPLFQAIVKLPKDMPPDTTRVWFVPEDTPYFYWLIPHSPTQGVLGLIGEGERQSQRCLEDFLERKGLEPMEFQDAQVSRYTRWIPNHRKIGEAHVYLVGDAAAHVKVSTVGGTVTGFRGALGVADAVLNGGPSREFMALRRELDLHLLIRKALNRFRRADYARLLDMISPSTKSLFSVFTRDESLKLLLRVFLRRPRLLLLGLRTLLNGRTPS